MRARALSNAHPLPFELSLRIRHPSMDPAKLSRELGLEAKHSFRAGEPRPSRHDAASPAVHGESYWLGTLDPTSWPSDTWASGIAKNTTRSLGWALSLTARRLVRSHAALFERIRVEGGQASLLVALSATAVVSFSLAPEVSRIFSALGTTVEFEMLTA